VCVFFFGKSVPGNHKEREREKSWLSFNSRREINKRKVITKQQQQFDDDA
jgi:hypothetical protein